MTAIDVLDDPHLRANYGPYQEQICAPLTEAIGAQFEVTHTGGFCMALQATLEGGDQLLITDAAHDVLSPMHARERCWRNDRECLGYSVSYHAKLDSEEVGPSIASVDFQRARDAEAVTIAVKACLRLAADVRSGLVESPATLVL